MSEAYFILELTTRCNLDCIYCYNVWKQKEIYSHKDMTLQDVKSLIASIKKSVSIKGITLAGGEPLLNKDVFQIASFLKAEGIKTALTTNGLLLNEDYIKRLIDCGVDHIEISMPTNGIESYEKLCKSQKLKQVRAAILNVKKHKVKLTVTSVITKYNLEEVFDIFELSAVFGADYFAFNRFVPGGKGLINENELKLNLVQLKQALNEANTAAKVYKIPVIIAIPVEHCLIDTSVYPDLDFGTCVCGEYKWVVDPSGNLRTCEQNPDILGNLLVDDFNVISHYMAVFDFRKNDSTDACKSQSCYAKCGGGCRFCR